MPTSSRIPACIGWLDRNERECVGGKNSETGEMEDACSFVDRCGLIRVYCDAKGIDVNEHIKPVDPVDQESFEKMLTQAQIFNEEKVAKKQPKVEKADEKPKHESKKKIEKSVAPPVVEESTQAENQSTNPTEPDQDEKPKAKRSYIKPVKSDIKEFDEFLLLRPVIEEIGNALGKSVGEGYAGNVDPKELVPGTVYLKDKTPLSGGNSRYVTFYIKCKKGKGLGAMLLILRQGGQLFNVEFPTLPENIRLPNIGDCADGQFKSMIKDFPVKDWKLLIKEFQRLYGAKKVGQGIHDE